MFGEDVAATETLTVEVGGRFDGQWVGTYSGGGGCLGLNGSGNISLSIQQNGPVLKVAFGLAPGIEEFSGGAGEAVILGESPHAFIANITQPQYVTGLLFGTMSEDRTEITGEMNAQAEWVCKGEPQIIPATGTFTVTRQRHDRRQ